MMSHLYRRLAMTNLKNNGQFYLPYLLAGMVSVMMFYIMCAIQGSESLREMRGFSILKLVLTFGIIVIGICVCIFLFYTNGFVMKRRKKELGVYNILGMEKRHIARVMIWESVILYVISMSGGLIFGIVFHKLAAMFLGRLTGLAESIPFYVSGWGCLHTVTFFGVIYFFMLLYNFVQVRIANPIELLHGNNVGEQEPKAKWISAAAGLVCIGVGYYMSINAYGVLEAVNMFFLAVLFVIGGTYLLFMSVSIALLKILKNNKKYYYKTSHFITVSGMLYRMKRNAVGLASICILSTMVLVAVSTTVCMYTGIEDSLQHNYEKEFSANIYFKSMPDDAVRNELLEQVEVVAETQNRTVTEVSEYVDTVFVIQTEGNVVKHYDRDNAAYNYSDMGMLYVFTKEDYEKYAGVVLDEIKQGEALIVSSSDFSEDVISIFGEIYPVTVQNGISQNFPNPEMKSFFGETGVLFVIVSDHEELDRIRIGSAVSAEEEGNINYHIEVEIDGTYAERKAYAYALLDALNACKEQAGFNACLMDSRAEHREDNMELNGGFLFLGVFLGILFLMITVLIIYYKQISEGYEDRERFAIMSKVGVSKDMIKAAINTQVRTIFFMPITVAVIHLVAAFPMLKLILQMFGLVNSSLFVACLAITAAVFAVIYFVVFKLTSMSYYKIVHH